MRVPIGALALSAVCAGCAAFDRVGGDRGWTTPETKDDIAGAVAPSTTDVHYYLNIMDDTGLQGAWSPTASTPCTCPPPRSGSSRADPDGSVGILPPVR